MGRGSFILFGLISSSVVCTDADAVTGPYDVSLKSYNVTDERTKFQSKISVWYPTNAVNSSLFISYAHGMSGGGSELIPAYEDLLHSMASFGYVIAATHACNVGCYDDDGISTCVSLEDDPPCYGEYYKEQLSTIRWAQSNNDMIFANVNWDAGVGIAGHSMGGQATLFSSSYSAADYNIKAAVMHHPYTHSFPSPQVPYIVFTGTADTTAPATTMAQPIFEVQDGSSSRGIVNKIGADHHEPDCLDLDPQGVKTLASYSAAWFKVYLDQTPQANGIDYYDMLFGSDSASVCGGGDGDMEECTIIQ
mmetsp:Transcript_41214/g.53157  ORF Transcript_41214/g.53157 Transcript_41214/m.53157 type:complete len:306 (+) Transcript_41214:13-930(+)